MSKVLWKQIKIFRIGEYPNLESAVNEFMIELISDKYHEPVVETNEKFITVIYYKLVDVPDKITLKK